MQRGWSMRVVHDTPTFEVQPAAQDQTGNLDPTKFSAGIGFRCAYSF
jgi:hypothetical protein